MRREPLGRVDELLERLYARLGWRILVAHFLAAWLFGALVAVCGVLIIARAERVSSADSAELVGWILLLLGAVCIPLGYLGTRRLLRPIADWFDAGRDPGRADAAWRAVHRLPLRISLWNAAVAVGVGMPGALFAIRSVAHPVGDFYPVGVLLFLVALTVGVGVGVFGLQLMLRPLIRDVAGSLERLRSWERGSSVRAKLLVALPFIALAGGVGGLTVGIEPGADWGELRGDMLVVALITAVILVPGAMLLAYSTLQPLDDLLRATERLKRGDFAMRVPELSGDEYGALARSFNEAMEGLAERALLADEVRASRARIVAASDAERRRVERNIHDGAQQRLVALALDLQMLSEAADSPEVRAMADEARSTLSEALDELRELARGLHPSVLASDGLAPALEQLAARAPVAVELDVPRVRFPEPVEATAYFVASEALANVGKYARATQARVAVSQSDGRLAIEIADDGIGGAEPRAGSGLAGLADRVAALEGTLRVESRAGSGTTIRAELPLPDRPRPDQPRQ